MDDIHAFGVISLGVFAGVVWPVLAGFIKSEFPPTAGRFPPWLIRYGALLIFCLLTSLIILAVYRSNNPGAQLDWVKAFLLGFGWESIVEKTFGRPLGGKTSKNNAN